MELYHVLNRGVEKRDIVLNDKDRVRFIHDLYVFNDANAAPNYILPGRHEYYSRDTLVHIHAFCLMPNHYHLLLSPTKENGVSLFMQKLNMGYAKYFNEKYERSGALWQGKYKKILLKQEAHFLYIPYYIHLNPLDLKYPQWRTGGVRDVAKALSYLEGYRWSSHLDYLGKKNFPSIIEKTLLQKILESRESYGKELELVIQDDALAQESLTLEN